MFRHHKFCVIEVSGWLVAYASRDNRLDVYLLDDAGSMDLSPGGTLSAAALADAIRVEDPSLVEYLCGHATPACGADYRYLLAARITATIDLDAEPAALLGVTAAVLQQGLTTLTYTPDH